MAFVIIFLITISGEFYFLAVVWKETVFTQIPNDLKYDTKSLLVFQGIDFFPLVFFLSNLS